MLRRLFKLMSALSLVLCLATALLWVRSYWIADAWGWAHGKRTIQCGIAAGRLRLDTTRLGDEGGFCPDASITHARYSAALDPPTSRLPATARNLGFATEHRFRAGQFDSRLLLVPLWLPMLALYGCAWMFRLGARRLRAAERLRRRLCTACGYDLRATPARCPECGHLPQWPTT